MKKLIEGNELLYNVPTCSTTGREPVVCLQHNLILDDGNCFESPILIEGNVGTGKTKLMFELMNQIFKYTEHSGDNAVKADKSKLQAVADAANAEIAKEVQTRPSAADWIFLIGLSLVVSAASQWVGLKMNAGFKAIGLAMFDKGTCTTVFVTVLGLICAMTPMGKLPAVNELSNVYLYAVVSLLASTATLVDLVAAPMWVVYGALILVIHVILMFLLSKLFHWDLCMCSTASVANIGGSASAPIIAVAYHESYAGIGVLMGVLGAAIGNFCGLAMGAILQLFV